jgi:hypothetical protein
MWWFLSSLVFIYYDYIQAQESIGLLASASSRGLLIGTASSIRRIHDDVDSGVFNSVLTKNVHLVTPEEDLQPHKIWYGENQYNGTESDWLLGATPDAVGWVQKNRMRVR